MAPLTLKFGQKNGLNLGEDFFWSLPKSGQKNRLNLCEDLFLVFIVLKFPAPPSPPFENPAYATRRELKPSKIVNV